MTSTTASTSVDETTPILNEQNGMAGFLVRLFVNTCTHACDFLNLVIQDMVLAII